MFIDKTGMIVLYQFNHFENVGRIFDGCLDIESQRTRNKFNLLNLEIEKTFTSIKTETVRVQHHHQVEMQKREIHYVKGVCKIN